MQRTMLKSNREFEQVAVIDVDNGAYDPRVVHIDAQNQIIHVDREVATLLSGAPTAA